MGKDSESYGIHSLHGFVLAGEWRPGKRFIAQWPVEGITPALWVYRRYRQIHANKGRRVLLDTVLALSTMGYWDIQAPHSHCLFNTLLSTGRAIGHRTYTHAGERLPFLS